ncbi:MAG: hypothetical protein ACE5NG_19300 [bacterium]
MGALWRFHTGDPYTAATMHVWGDSPVFHSFAYYETGAKNSARYPSYHSLDLKIEKEWRIKNIRLVTYLNTLFQLIKSATYRFKRMMSCSGT